MPDVQTEDAAMKSTLDDLSREVRFGAVLYGGVSLAVYENGVAQELFRATKGAGIYTVIKQLTGSEILLDIISGTSAGGINGILIGYALANGTDPSRCGDLWREDGDILKLLHQPSDADPNSILNSENYYQPRLAQAFAGLSTTYQPKQGDLAAELEDLDLFVTGTNACGHIYTEFDSFGHAIDVKNHRALFNLRYRRLIQEDNDFRFGVGVYAKLSRITSCFPVAFAPVPVNDPQQPDEAADECLRKWGHLTKKPQYYLDGGILNNKPFSSTLKAIFHHTQTRDVERLLVYVEPDPESFKGTSADSRAPGVLAAAADGLISIPGYQSIAQDLDAIAEHNNWVMRYEEIERGLSRVSDSLMKQGQPYDSPATISDLGGLSGESGSNALMQGIIFSAPESVANLERVSEQAAIYLESRLTQLRERVLKGILRMDGHLLYLKDGQRRAAKSLVKTFREWQEKIAPNERSALLQAMRTFDVYYRMRRLFYITNRISEMLNSSDAPISGDDRDKYRDLWRRLNHRLKLLELARTKMEQLLDCADFHWKELTAAADPRPLATKLWENAQTFLGLLLERSGRDDLPPLPATDAAVRQWNPSDDEARSAEENQQRMNLHKALDERTKHWVQYSERNTLDLNLTPPTDILLQHTDHEEWEIFKNFAPGGANDVISQHYCRFIFVDMHLFPMQYMSGFESTDKVTTVRFSPIDAKLGFSGDSRKKLCGNELGHFGGFLKSSWRANDLMWGRLDAACQIIQSVVTYDNLKNMREKLDPSAQAFLLQSLRGRCQNSSDADFQSLAKSLADFVAANDHDLRKAAFDHFLSALVFMAQREILQTEVPNVIAASIEQQGAWNQYDLPEPFKNPGAKRSPRPAHSKSRWRFGRHQGDKAVTTYAAIKFAEQTQSGATTPGWGAAYFKSNYDFRDETWQNGIPKPVLIEIITTMLLVLKKCLIVSAQGTNNQERVAVIARSWFLRIVILPIWLGYRLTRVQRFAPEYFNYIIIALFVLGVSILGMDWYAYNLGAPVALTLWLIPAVVLVSVVILVLLMSRRSNASNAPLTSEKSPETFRR